MNDYLEISKSLASFALFRELYDSKKDIYDIIAEFLKELILSKAKHQFNLTEITQLLNNEFDFSIPEAVVKTSLNRLAFLNKSYGVYAVDNLPEIQRNSNLKDKFVEKQQNNNLIIQKLIEYIEEEKNTKLSEEEKNKIVYSFCSFILDDSTVQDYSEFISAFIIKNKQNSYFAEKLSIIKEGVVLYSGLKYNPDPSKLGSWNTDLTIYLDTEILFHLAGYNGQLFYTLFKDFYSYVKEINQVSQRKYKNKRIHLKYFIEVKDEIENFFKKAEDILNAKDKPNPSITAMKTILDGCHKPSDIIIKKTCFYKLLNDHNIHEDDFNQYYNNKYYRYNIEDNELIQRLTESTMIEDVADHLKFLNYVSIHRNKINASTNNFENIGYILLTGNSNTLKVAFDKNIRVEKEIPLATTLDFLTNRFWFKLNKGFGNNNFPKNFDIITKAQVILSNQLNESVGRKYDELQKKYKNGSLTKEEAIAVIAELRIQSKRPEEIDESDISDVLNSISNISIEKYIQEQELLKNKTHQQEIEYKKLKQELLTKQAEVQKKEEELKQKNLELETYKNAEKEKEEKIRKRKNILQKTLRTLSILVFIVGSILLYLYLNKIAGIITFIFSVIIPILKFFGINIESLIRKRKKDHCTTAANHH